MKQPKPTLRKAPSTEALAEQQAAIARLLALNEWTEEPANPPPATDPQPEVLEGPPRPAKRAGKGVAPPKPVEAPVAPPEPPPELPKKPWEIPSEDKTHPYHIIMSERLWQQLDYVWKRQGHLSLKELILKTLQERALQGLRDLKEIE